MPIGKIDDLPFEINSIITSIKVLTTQELQINQNSQYTQVLATYRHFKSSNIMPAPLIDVKKEKLKPTWKAYQVL
ncbi:hypothetical protein G9A89_000677 [Geosiphon pyriformis]|nr:hypothetical protein G9A89_000677 [Geosiphon pyriformis]